MHDAANMIEYWQSAGRAWVVQQERLDHQLATWCELARERLAAREGESILDVGCGCGGSSLALARSVGPRGSVTGVDVSAPMLARARERSTAAGLDDRIHFIEADAGTVELAPEFHGIFSRFGAMFFDDPIAAFTNLRRALLPGGRLSVVCWRALEENHWLMAPMRAVTGLLELPPPPEDGAPGPLAFADGARLEAVLESAGFAGVKVEKVDAIMVLGGDDLDRAVEVFIGVGPIERALRETNADDARRRRIADVVRAALSRYATGGQVRASSAAWIACARSDG